MFSYRYFIIFILLILIGLGFYVYHWEYRKPLFEVNFFSLNRGRGIFIRTPDNKTILVGGGQNTEILRELTKVMPFYSKNIDYVLIPSASQTQIGGLIEIVDRYEIGEIIQSKYIATSTVLSQLQKAISKKKIHIKEVERGDSIEIGRLKMNILFPIKDFKFNKTSLPELGVSFEYKNIGLFLFGNLSKTIQKDILKNLDIMTTQNIVEYYHSGIKTKVSSELIEALNPIYIFSTKEKGVRWISDGEGWNSIK